MQILLLSVLVRALTRLLPAEVDFIKEPICASADGVRETGLPATPDRLNTESPVTTPNAVSRREFITSSSALLAASQVGLGEGSGDDTLAPGRQVISRFASASPRRKQR
jgi:hypothetical protein